MTYSNKRSAQKQIVADALSHAFRVLHDTCIPELVEDSSRRESKRELCAAIFSGMLDLDISEGPADQDPYKNRLVTDVVIKKGEVEFEDVLSSLCREIIHSFSGNAELSMEQKIREAGKVVAEKYRHNEVGYCILRALTSF